jgi:hypothetical protein
MDAGNLVSACVSDLGVGRRLRLLENRDGAVALSEPRAFVPGADTRCGYVTRNGPDAHVVSMRVFVCSPRFASTCINCQSFTIATSMVNGVGLLLCERCSDRGEMCAVCGVFVEDDARVRTHMLLRELYQHEDPTGQYLVACPDCAARFTIREHDRANAPCVAALRAFGARFGAFAARAATSAPAPAAPAAAPPPRARAKRPRARPSA